GPPERVEGADARIARPGEHELPGAPRPDHLVVDEVGGEAAEDEVAAPLPDDLVAGGEADQGRETLDHDGVPVAHEAADRLPHREDLRAGASGREPAQRAFLLRPAAAKASSRMSSARSHSARVTTRGGQNRIVLRPHERRTRPRAKASRRTAPVSSTAGSLVAR